MKVRPEILSITHRKPGGLSLEDMAVDGVKGNPILTAFMAVLSGVFPEGEMSFIRAVKDHEHQISDDDPLKAEIKDFVRQEASHTHEHVIVNKRFAELGWPSDMIDRRMKRSKKRMEKRVPARRRLASTAALEHLTASFAHYLLSNPQLAEGTHPNLFRLFTWHAVEEIEHKAVAFDVYQKCVADEKLRVRSMRQVLFAFPIGTSLMTLYFLFLNRKNIKVTWAHVKQAYAALYGKNGIYSSVNALL